MISAQERSEITNYYKETRLQYFFWSGKTRALHFSYFLPDSGHKSGFYAMNDMLAGKVLVKRGEEILDAGCGVGGTSLWLAKKYSANVAGISIVPEQITEAKKQARREHLDDVAKFYVQDFTSTTFPDSTFDVVWAQESSVHLTHAQRPLFFKEAYRVLKPGGRLLIAEYLLNHDPKKEEKTIIKEWLDGWAMYSLLSTEQMEREFIQNGFKNIQITDVSEHIKPSIKTLKKRSRLAYKYGPLAIKLRLIGETELKNIKGSIRQAEAFDKGLWRFKVFVGSK